MGSPYFKYTGVRPCVFQRLSPVCWQQFRK